MTWHPGSDRGREWDDDADRGFGRRFRRRRGRAAAGAQAAPDEAEIAIVSRDNFTLFTPMLPEVSSGGLEPRHVVTPVRAQLHRTTFVLGEIAQLDLAERHVEARHPLTDAMTPARVRPSRPRAGQRHLDVRHPRRRGAHARAQDARGRRDAAQPRRRGARTGRRDAARAGARSAVDLCRRRRRLHRLRMRRRAGRFLPLDPAVLPAAAAGRRAHGARSRPATRCSPICRRRWAATRRAILRAAASSW